MCLPIQWFKDFFQEKPAEENFEQNDVEIQNTAPAEEQPPQQLNPQESQTLQSPVIDLTNYIRDDLKAYMQDPVNMVMDAPGKALIYTIAIKVCCLFISLLFPFIGYSIFGMSVMLIDRVILINYNEFLRSLPWLGSVINFIFPQGIPQNRTQGVTSAPTPSLSTPAVLPATANPQRPNTRRG